MLSAEFGEGFRSVPGCVGVATIHFESRFECPGIG